MRSPRFDRRHLLRLGTAGLFGWTLPDLLYAREVAGNPGKDRSCIFVVLSGGPGHIDTWDPKPQAPAEVRGLYSSIPTRTPGVRLTEMFPLLAQQSHRYCLVRSMSHADTVHVSAAHTMLTGQPDGAPRNDSPMLGSLIAKLKPSAERMPSHVWLHNMKTGTNKVPRYDSGLSKVGFGCAPLRIGHELDNPTSPNFHVDLFDPPDDVSPTRLTGRLGLLDAIERPADPTRAAFRRYADFHSQAREMVSGPKAREAFDLSLEPDRVRDRYGRHPLGQYSLMARRLIEAGVRLVTVTGWPGLAPGETTPTVTQVWDTHDDRYPEGDSMFGDGPFGMKWSLPRLDQAVSALLEDLDDRGLLDETLVVVLGEFGRTPKFEGKGRGRGHWPQCYTALLAGGGVRGGTVHGSSDRQGAFVATGRPVSHADFGATLLHSLGIPPETRYGPDGFSLRASDGEPLQEIFG